VHQIRLLAGAQLAARMGRRRRAAMPAGANRKREREYQELKDAFKNEHRYPGREEEVAARIVNKQRAAAGETETDRRPAKKASKAAKSTKSTKPAAPRKRSKASTRHTRH
jgi:hypothetical protein